MITIGMTNSEIVKELNSIEDTLVSRLNEYWKKFGRKLKSEDYGHNAVLGVQEDVINGNRVVLCFQKVVYTDQLSDLRVSKMVITEDNYAFLSVRNESGDLVFIRFSNHAIDRIYERGGMTLQDFFVNEFVRKAGTSLCLIKYEGHGKTDFNYTMTIGECYFIVAIHDNRIDVVTDLDWSILFKNQMALYVKSKSCAEKFANKTYDKDAVILKGIGIKNTKDLLRVMCV